MNLPVFGLNEQLLMQGIGPCMPAVSTGKGRSLCAKECGDLPLSGFPCFCWWQCLSPVFACPVPGRPLVLLGEPFLVVAAKRRPPFRVIRFTHFHGEVVAEEADPIHGNRVFQVFRIETGHQYSIRMFLILPETTALTISMAMPWVRPSTFITRPATTA